MPHYLDNPHPLKPTNLVNIYVLFFKRKSIQTFSYRVIRNNWYMADYCNYQKRGIPSYYRNCFSGVLSVLIRKYMAIFYPCCKKSGEKKERGGSFQGAI